MIRHEPSQTYLVPLELEYQCPKCGKVFNIKKAYSPADDDIITIRYVRDYGDATK